jgi:serine protease Do
MNRLRKSIAALVLSGGALGAWFGGHTFMRNAAFAEQQRDVKATAEQLATASDLSSAFRNVGKVLEPSVVHISVHKTIKGAGDGLPFDEDLLRRFFKDRDGNARPHAPRRAPDPDDENDPGDGGSFDQVGSGSGVIMEADGSTGYILTNNHVAGDASEISVTLADGRQVNGKLVGHDPKSDLAVVKIAADHLIPAKWGDSSTLHKGDWILAFGSPFGYIGSMTHGIVSALDRTNIGILAPINPGNSGGPLVNLHGEVVGINTAIASHTGAFSGIGFAIPSKEARFVYTALKSSGKVVRGWLGVSIADVARKPQVARSFGYKSGKGVLVEQTFPNTPASGKLQSGDIIEAIDGSTVDSVLALRNAIASTSPNTEVNMTVFRDGKDQNIKLKLGEQPEDLTVMAGDRGARAPRQRDAGASSEAFGMTLTNVTDDLAEQFNLGEQHQPGALVTKVKAKSAAAKAGIVAGDLITRVGNTPVKNATEAGDLLKHDLKTGVRVFVVNPEGARFVFIEP